MCNAKNLCKQAVCYVHTVNDIVTDLHDKYTNKNVNPGIEECTLGIPSNKCYPWVKYEQRET